MNHATTAAAALLMNAIPMEAAAADLRKGTLTLAAPKGASLVVRAGTFLVVDQDAAREALAADAAILDRVPFLPVGAMVGVYVRDDDSRGRGAGYAITVQRENSHCSLYREHTPDEGREASWTPWTWWGRMYRTDENGDEWDTTLGRMVCDDFGSLVRVPK